MTRHNTGQITGQNSNSQRMKDSAATIGSTVTRITPPVRVSPPASSVPTTGFGPAKRGIPIKHALPVAVRKESKVPMHAPPPTPAEPSSESQPPAPMRVDFPNLGSMLEYLRETVDERTGRRLPDMPPLRLTSKALTEYLTKNGYPIGQSAYSLMESGETVPRDAAAFFDAFCRCTAIPRGSLYWVLLRCQYLHELARRSFGEADANSLVPCGEAYLSLLPEETREALLAGKTLVDHT